MTTPRHIPQFDAAAWVDAMREELARDLPDLILDDSDPWTYAMDYVGRRLNEVIESANASIADAFAAQARQIVEATALLAIDTPQYVEQRVKELRRTVIDVAVRQSQLLTTATTIYMADDGWIQVPEAERDAIVQELTLDRRKPVWLRYGHDDIQVNRFAISGEIFYDSRYPAPVQQAAAQLTERIPPLSRLGGSIYLSSIHEALTVHTPDGDAITLGIDLAFPASDLATDNPQIVHVWNGATHAFVYTPVSVS